MGNLEKSSQYSHEALELARNQKIPQAEATVLGNLADLQLRMGNSNDSLALSSQSLASLRRIGADPGQEAAVLYTHSQAQRALGKPEEALVSLRMAIDLLERARLLSVPTETAKSGVFARRSDVFLATIDLLVSLGRENEALSVSESYHARAFLDSLVEARADLRPLLPKKLVQKEKTILGRISELQRELWQEGIGQDRELQLKKELVAAEDALDEFQLEVRRSNPKYAGLKYLQPFTHDRIQRELLDADTALIEYAIGDRKSFAWFVSKDKVSCAALPAKKELNSLIADYRKSLTERVPALAARQAIQDLKRRGRQLYQVLLEPFDSILQSFPKLIIVPDNALSYLPFETLVAERGGKGQDANGHYLLERFSIVYAPSASALAAVRAGQAAGSAGLLAFGDPVYSVRQHAQGSDSDGSKLGYYAGRGFDFRRLPYTRTEVTSIGTLFAPAERQVFVGEDANEQKVKSERLERYRYLHFAAHGVVDEENPGRSGIILSLGGSDKEDGILQMTEIMRLKLGADLVTLSACRTGMGKVVSGEGVLGLSRAFIYAGARSVAVSLWNVNDTATADLMKRFYRGMNAGTPKDEALRQAKLDLLNGRQAAWRHPYFWGSFVLVGAE
jgi:CHAT domain-containing protein